MPVSKHEAVLLEKFGPESKSFPVRHDRDLYACAFSLKAVRLCAFARAQSMTFVMREEERLVQVIASELNGLIKPVRMRKTCKKDRAAGRSSCPYDILKIST